ncbi:MAG: tRNA dihydrouridine synthase DusB [Candidatus Marinimicrobia bacterium]|nr:tRNA dihydrouridine synthase DusB [Candidatus Neomarinimicrobiota bacterium]
MLKPITLHDLTIPVPVFLAPMAGFTDKPFRTLCKSFGAGVVYTEFVSSEGIVRENEKTIRYMRFDEAERPVGVQIFGDDPETLARSAQFIEEKLKPDIIDLNFGCPVPKVVKKGAGSAILRDLDHMEKIAASLVRATSLPVTVKMRSGWDNGHIVAVEAARRLEAAGIRMITLHPRTTKQRYEGLSDWRLIAEVKKAVRIPVIGNGDILTPQDAERMIGETGCDGIMIGRGAMGKPWLFRDVIRFLTAGELLPPPSKEMIAESFFRHLTLQQEHYSLMYAGNLFKPHASAYIRGMDGAAHMRFEINRAKDIEQIRELADDFFSSHDLNAT